MKPDYDEYSYYYVLSTSINKVFCRLKIKRHNSNELLFRNHIRDK